MSGIYGFAAHKVGTELAVILDNMCEAISPPGPSIKHQWLQEQNCVGLGAIHPVISDYSVHFAQDRSCGVICVFDGVIY